MKRSEINAIVRSAQKFFGEHQFYLPPFSAWTPDQWRTKGPEVCEIPENQLGWDITDFGLGDFRKCGLLLFTVRNGRAANLHAMQGKVYAEKIMIAEAGQVTPWHFHWQKTEDIINRGGGTLVVRLHNSSKTGKLADSEITVNLDGVTRTMKAGDMVKLSPGESITLPPRLYHTFWGEGDRVLVGEVSVVNDDRQDNRFLEPLGRFPQIVEDEPPLHLLTVDYPQYYLNTAVS